MTMRTATTLSLLLLCTSLPFQVKAYTYPAYNGEVEFNHVGHRKNFICGDCHEGPPKKMDFDHDSAHKFCMGCHKKLYSGPLQHCNDCHKLPSAKLQPVQPVQEPAEK